MDTIPAGTTHVKVHASVTTISACDNVFADHTDLIEVVFPVGLQTIELGAFAGCSSLLRIAVPGTVRVILERTFAGCISLAEIHLSEGLREIQDDAFAACKSVTTLSFPSTLQRLGGLKGCSSLSDIQLNEGLISIGSDAFRQCESLVQVAVPSTVEGIGGRAFKHCHSLLEMMLPEGFRIMGSSAFHGCRSLQRVSLPSTLETILEHQFEGCISLVDVCWSEGLRRTSRAFHRFWSLQRVSLPSTLKTIAEQSFEGCFSLMDVYLSEGLRHIGRNAFCDCFSMTAISLPKSIESIDRCAFMRCLALLGVQISSATTKHLIIEQDCFATCLSLVNIRIPPSLEDCSYSVFDGCNMLCGENGEEPDWISLQERFADLPVHDACYHSSHIRMEDLIETVKCCDQDELVDMFGMTPFHILSTSAILSVDLLEALMSKYPLEVVHQKDSHDMTMMDYLLKNRASNSSPLLKLVLQRTIIDEMNDWGLGRYRADFCELVESKSWDVNIRTRLGTWTELKKSFSSEVKTEMASLLELAVWKRNIQLFATDRSSCRMMGGADVIPSSVITFLWDESTRIGYDFE